MDNAHLVELVAKNWHHLEPQLRRWKEILTIPRSRTKNNYVPWV
jgi:hypothetical protein